LIIVFLQKGDNSRYRSGSRVAALPKVEDEARIAHGKAAEAGGRDVTLAKEFFDLFQQMHGVFLMVVDDSARGHFPINFLLV
jgi:hypothetical protein